MADTTARSTVRVPPADKFEAKRRELAAAAQTTLAELGYAETSLREIAQNTKYSHGVLHYYFADKAELITYSVTLYKEECATRYDEIVASSVTADELRARFAEALRVTLVEDSAMHRLWYDLRNQAMFDERLRAEVLILDDLLEQMIWRVVDRYQALTDAPLATTPNAAYGLLDGLFLQALLRHVAGDPAAGAQLEAAAFAVLPTFLGSV